MWFWRFLPVRWYKRGSSATLSNLISSHRDFLRATYPRIRYHVSLTLIFISKTIQAWLPVNNRAESFSKWNISMDYFVGYENRKTQVAVKLSSSSRTSGTSRANWCVTRSLRDEEQEGEKSVFGFSVSRRRSLLLLRLVVPAATSTYTLCITNKLRLLFFFFLFAHETPFVRGDVSTQARTHFYIHLYRPFKTKSWEVCDSDENVFFTRETNKNRLGQFGRKFSAFFTHFEKNSRADQQICRTENIRPWQTKDGEFFLTPLCTFVRGCLREWRLRIGGIYTPAL